MSTRQLKNPYVSESNGRVKIGNELVELGFDPDRKGALVSIVDKASGYQFVRDGEAPKTLFRLALRRQADRRYERERGGEHWPVVCGMGRRPDLPQDKICRGDDRFPAPRQY